MSDDKKVKVKMLSLVEEHQMKTTSNGKELYPVTIRGAVDGTEQADKMAVTCWGKSALEALKSGAELDATEKAWNGNLQWTAFAPRPGGGGGGFRGKSPEESASIRRQCALKAVVELIVHDKLDIKQMRASLDEIDLMLAAKPKEL